MPPCNTWVKPKLIEFAKRRDHDRNVDNDNSLSRKINASWNLTLSSSKLSFRCPFSLYKSQLCVYHLRIILRLRHWRYSADYISRTQNVSVRILETRFPIQINPIEIYFIYKTFGTWLCLHEDLWSISSLKWDNFSTKASIIGMFVPCDWLRWFFLARSSISFLNYHHLCSIQKNSEDRVHAMQVDDAISFFNSRLNCKIKIKF